MRDIRKAALLIRDLDTPGAGRVTGLSEMWEARYSVDGIGQRGDSGGGMMWQLGLYGERRE